MSERDEASGLRPANVAARLPRGSAACVINPRQLLQVDPPLRGVMLAAPAPFPAALPGLVRAAKDSAAIIGLACPFRPGDRSGAEQFFAEAVRSIGELSHPLPVFLQAGPVRLGSAAELTLRAQDVFRFVDAGFTLVSVDASRLEADTQPRVYSTLLASVVQAELAVEVAAPRSPGGVADAEALRALLRGLADEGVRVDFVRVPSFQLLTAPSSEPFPDAERIAALIQGAREQGAELTVEEPVTTSRRWLGFWGEAGAAKMDAAGVFSAVLTGLVGNAERELLVQKALAAGLSPAELIALRPEMLGDLPVKFRERIEALSYVEAMGLFPLLGARRAGARCLQQLRREGP